MTSINGDTKKVSVAERQQAILDALTKIEWRLDHLEAFANRQAIVQQKQEQGTKSQRATQLEKLISVLITTDHHFKDVPEDVQRVEKVSKELGIASASMWKVPEHYYETPLETRRFVDRDGAVEARVPYERSTSELSSVHLRSTTCARRSFSKT